jgi:hypothetical protein
VTWDRANDDAQSRPSHVEIQGNIVSEGMRNQGLPMFKRLKAEIPTRISLLRSGDIWSGQIDAEDLSGNIAYIQGVRSRLVYQTVLNKEKARNLGFGALPMFDTPKPLTVNIALDGSSNEASIKLDTITANLGWHKDEAGETTQRQLKMTLLPDDWAKLGLPSKLFTPAKPLPVVATWTTDYEILSGHVAVADQVIDFDMPSENRDLGYGLKVSGSLNDTLAQALGYHQDPFEFSGQAAFLVVSSEVMVNDTSHTQTSVTIDAKDADIKLVGTAWHKPAGEVTRFALIVAQPEGTKGMDISRLYAEGDKVKIEGRAAFDENGRLSFADIGQFYLADFADMAVRFYDVPESVTPKSSIPESVTKGSNTKIVSIKGAQLDIHQWMQKKAAPEAVNQQLLAQPKQPVHFVVDLKRFKTAPDAEFKNLNIDLNWDGGNNISGTGQALVGNSGILSATFGGNDHYSRILFETDNIGDTVRAFTGSKQLRGGAGSFDGYYQDGQIDGTFAGKKINAREIPFLAQLLTFASLEGLANTLTGEGIRFSSFEIPVRYRDHLLFVNEGWAKGDAIGLNFKGTVETNTQALKLSGTLVPAYGFNSFFGDVSANGLGLVGLKYNVSGTYKAPQSVVNPLSLVFPGFVKKWFTTKKEDPIAPLDISVAKDNSPHGRESKLAN